MHPYHLRQGHAVIRKKCNLGVKAVAIATEAVYIGVTVVVVVVVVVRPQCEREMS